MSETDADTIIYSIERFVEHLKKNDKDKSLTDLTYQIDLEKVTETTEFVYRNIPYFLTSEDYHRIDSLLETQDYIHTQIRNGKQMLIRDDDISRCVNNRTLTVFYSFEYYKSSALAEYTSSNIITFKELL